LPRARIVVMVPLLFWPFFFELPAVTYLLFWLVTQLFGGAIAGLGPEQVAGVAWWAHVGGFAAGVLLHRAFMLPQRQRPRRLFPDELGFDTVAR
jgi:membrane associated rhomboid family serine protease